jgi:hypothetical protein
MGIRTCDLHVFSAVPQQTAPPRAPIINIYILIIKNTFKVWGFFILTSEFSWNFMQSGMTIFSYVSGQTIAPIFKSQAV